MNNIIQCAMCLVVTVTNEYVLGDKSYVSLCEICYAEAAKSGLTTYSQVATRWNKSGEKKRDGPERDWRKWVYGGQRNPMKDTKWP